MIRRHFEENRINRDTVVVHSPDGELVGSLPIDFLVDPAAVAFDVLNAMVDEVRLESGVTVVKWRGLISDEAGRPAGAD